MWTQYFADATYFKAQLLIFFQSRLLELMKLQDQFDGGGVSIVNADRELVHKDKVKVISLKSGKVSEKVIHLVSATTQCNAFKLVL